jgi:hypothetical protein
MWKRTCPQVYLQSCGVFSIEQMKCLEVYSIISATWEAETGGPWVQGHSGQTSETVFQTKLNKPKRNKETFSRKPSSIWYLALFLKLFFLASYISEGFLFCFVLFCCICVFSNCWFFLNFKYLDMEDFSQYMAVFFSMDKFSSCGWLTPHMTFELHIYF